jgi:hypothetical protein
MINDINSWKIFDECPGIALDSIYPVSKRAVCLIARNKIHPLLKSDFFRFQGAIEMMQGLDYHHDRFMTTVNQLAEIGLDDAVNGLQIVLLHEATAYLNRLGQFYYFLDSKFVQQICPTTKSLAPDIVSFVFFRNKSTAHRSIDKPDKWRPESPHIQSTQAMSMSSIGGRLFEPKPGQTHDLSSVKSAADAEKFEREKWSKCFRVFQLIGHPQGFINFSPERNHPAIMEQAYSILVQILK